MTVLGCLLKKDREFVIWLDGALHSWSDGRHGCCCKETGAWRGKIYDRVMMVPCFGGYGENDYGEKGGSRAPAGEFRGECGCQDMKRQDEALLDLAVPASVQAAKAKVRRFYLTWIAAPPRGGRLIWGN